MKQDWIFLLVNQFDSRLKDLKKKVKLQRLISQITFKRERAQKLKGEYESRVNQVKVEVIGTICCLCTAESAYVHPMSLDPTPPYGHWGPTESEPLRTL